ALAEIEANKTSRNGDDCHDSGTGSRRIERAARECTYSDFLKCQPLNFKGTEGVVGLTQWLEKMESVFQISNYTTANQVKFATFKKYVGGLPDMIYGSVMASKPKTMQDEIEFATELMDQKIRTLGLGKRNCTEDLNLYALNATITMTGSVLPSAPTVIGLSIQPGTVEASLPLPTTTIEPKG
ncbi:hypothetical protein Tco_0118842, partial [Tanacetum coccineum]